MYHVVFGTYMFPRKSVYSYRSMRELNDALVNEHELPLGVIQKLKKGEKVRIECMYDFVVLEKGRSRERPTP